MKVLLCLQLRGGCSGEGMEFRECISKDFLLLGDSVISALGIGMEREGGLGLGKNDGS